MIPTNTTFLFESLQLIEVSALVRGLNCKHILLLHTEEMKPRKLCRISYQTMPLLSFIAVCTIFIPCSICQHTTNEHIESSLLLFHKNQVKPPSEERAVNFTLPSLFVVHYHIRATSHPISQSTSFARLQG